MRAMLALLGLLGSLSAACAFDELPYEVASWPEAGYGNHRAVVRVAKAAPVVWAHVPWRRRDPQPEGKAVLVYDVAGQRVLNAVAVDVTREAGDIYFEAKTPGEYYLYYLPYKPGTGNFDDPGSYFPPEVTATPGWLARVREGGDPWRDFPTAVPLRIEARTEFDRMDPMEVIAGADGTRWLLEAHPAAAYLVFPEDRKYPIRMTEDLPLRWAKFGPASSFAGQAQPGEYYVFQLGVWACQEELREVRVACPGLAGESGRSIEPGAFTCFNTGGRDWLGRPLRKQVTVQRGQVQALWCGVQVPPEASGTYHGTMTVQAAGRQSTAVQLSLGVAGAPLPDGGVGDLSRLARLKWLNSSLGLDDRVVPPFTPLVCRGATVRLLGRSVRFGAEGLPESITSNGREILAAPLALRVRTGGTDLTLGESTSAVLRQAEGVWERRSVTTGRQAELQVTSRTEADGCLTFTARLRARKDLALSDVRLELPLRRDCAPYLMGMGKRGGYRPAEWRWRWDPARANNMVWVGDADAGVQLKLCGPQDKWLPSSWSPEDLPASWHNAGRGGCDILERDGGVVLVNAYTGERRLRAGQALALRFRLLVTPFKPLDRRHWNWRYGDVRGDATVLHVHHGTPENPYINYPFLTAPQLTDLVRSVRGLRTRQADPGSLEYAAPGNLDPRQGALHLWVRVNFDPAVGAPGAAQYNQALLSLDWPNRDQVGFYWNVDDRGMRAYTRLGAPEHNRYPVLFGTHTPQWRRGERHLLTLSWGEELAVYVDGALQGRAPCQGLLATPLEGAKLLLQGQGFLLEGIKVTDTPYAAGATVERTVDGHTLLLDSFAGAGGGATRPQRAAGGRGGRLLGTCHLTTAEAGCQLAFRYREEPVPPRGVNLYYTVRELSNHVAEMWPLRSLGDEVLVTRAGAQMAVGEVVFGQVGGGYPWLREHLVSGYRPGWRQPLPWLGQTDAAVEVQGLSRWHNYYVEGLNWLSQTTGLDGLYLDGIGYDREIMKRVAKVLYRNNPAARINYHSGDGWSPPWDPDRRVSPANATMEHFPYLSNLWFGELYDYNLPPDYWLVEISGIPFGLTSEMLNYENGGNPYRGMVYGMSGRQHPSAPALWRFWDEFGIQDAEWEGYWSRRCPVRTDNPQVLASVYRKPHETLIALAHWPVDSARRRTATAPACRQAPAIDGRQAPGEWDGAAVLGGFCGHGLDTAAEHGTRVQVTWDSARLYLRFECDSPLPPVAAQTARDGAVWQDDAVELFLQPDPEQERYYQFVGNSRGTIFDCRGLGEPGWNGNWTYAPFTAAGHWGGELSLAWADLGMAAPQAGHVLGLNACRDQQVPRNALSCWSPVNGPFHDRSQFGRLTLAAAGTPPTAAAPPAPAPLAVRLRVDWKALGLDPARVTLEAPAIAHFQEAREFRADEPLPVETAKGWLLVAKEK